ncbi:MAG: hypothetical protein Tsb0021_16630 [Chlamydiales bacterium]
MEKLLNATLPNGTVIKFTGPRLEEGPLPALFYFVSSAEHSLDLDPYNQPIQFLKENSIRCFSVDLPHHQSGYEPEAALSRWAQDLMDSSDPITPFIETLKQCLDFLDNQNVLEERKIAAAGLSRGGYIATLIAANDPRIDYVCGFAPLTQFTAAPTFHQLDQADIPGSLNLDNIIDKLRNIHLRYYIGNRDMRVSTRSCYEFIEKLVESKFQSGERSPQAELIISPSVGHLGHGTLPQTFQQGAEWIRKKLL